MCSQPTAIEFSLPEWVNSYIGTTKAIVAVEDRMQFVIDAAHENIRESSGGPFAAAVFEADTGRLVSLGVNLVTNQGLSILHAEIVAMTLAQRKLGIYDLGAAGLPRHELVTSAEPCAMCFGAIPWSGISRLVVGARDADARSIGFDEGPKLSGWQMELENRGITVTVDIKRVEASMVLKEYLALGGHLYNSREGD